MAEDYPDMAMMEETAVAPANPYSFTLPGNFTPPEDYEEGKPFDAVVSMVLSDGNLTLQSINGTPLTQAEEADELEEEMPMEEDMVDDQMAAEDGGSTLTSELQSFRETA